MSGKDKLRKFRENESFPCLYQPTTQEVLNKGYCLKGKWGADVFKNNNPIILELGCGKGEYTIELAQKYPNNNYIGIDIKGARLWKGAKYATEHSLTNVAFIRTRIDFIDSLFDESEVSQIWITFPDPQIKKWRKRLTGSLFLNRYLKFLNTQGIINLKTDSRFLHEYTLELCKCNNFNILEADNNIYGNNNKNEVLSIKTFYESHYIKLGLNITYLAFIPNRVLELKEPIWNEDFWEKEELKGRELSRANKG